MLHKYTALCRVSDQHCSTLLQAQMIGTAAHCWDTASTQNSSALQRTENLIKLQRPAPCCEKLKSPKPAAECCNTTSNQNCNALLR